MKKLFFSLAATLALGMGLQNSANAYPISGAGTFTSTGPSSGTLLCSGSGTCANVQNGRIFFRWGLVDCFSDNWWVFGQQIGGDPTPPGQDVRIEIKDVKKINQ